MSGKMATCARADQLNRWLGAQQMDLFGSPALTTQCAERRSHR
jgi:hypothetical protein